MTWVVGRHNNELWSLVRIPEELPNLHRRTGDKLVLGRCQTIAKRSQQATLKVRERREPLAWLANLGEVSAKRKPTARPARKPLEGCPNGIVGPSRFLLALEPGVDTSLNVTLEDLGKVMVAIELVLVGDARERLNRIEDSHD